MSAPFPPVDIEPLFAPWAGARGILLAVSGGPDSLALLLLAARWAKAASRPPLFAATVDHDLRREAAEEAQLAAEAAARLRIPHKTLHWIGDKPATGIQEAARDARYALLIAHARDIGADVLTTAHHADDQAETVLFRLMRGSGVAGIAGMRPRSVRAGVSLTRPLLGLHKQELVEICRDAGQAFAEDPSNFDPRFARTRTRTLLRELEPRGLGAPVWAKLAERAARADAALSLAATRAAEKALSFPRDGEAAIDLAALADEAEETRLRVLAAALNRIAPHVQLRLERLEAASQRLLNAGECRAKLTLTLAGCRLRYDGTALLQIVREQPRRRGVVRKN